MAKVSIEKVSCQKRVDSLADSEEIFNGVNSNNIDVPVLLQGRQMIIMHDEDTQLK